MTQRAPINASQLNEVSVIYTTGRIYLEEKYAEIPATALDSGAVHNSINVKVVDTLGLRRTAITLPYRAECADEHIASYTERVSFNLTIAGITRQITAIIENGNVSYNILLGMSAMHQFHAHIDWAFVPVKVYFREMPEGTSVAISTDPKSKAQVVILHDLPVPGLRIPEYVMRYYESLERSPTVLQHKHTWYGSLDFRVDCTACWAKSLDTRKKSYYLSEAAVAAGRAAMQKAGDRKGGIIAGDSVKAR